MLIFQRKKMCNRLLVGGALLAAGISVFSCKDAYDLDSESNQPEAGSKNIYGFMREQGKYNTYLQLVDDLDYATVLSKSGSKTLFPADDDAFTKFFQSNKWGVHSYGELTTAQKKLLLYSSMIDNPYSTSMLTSTSTSDGTLKGKVCRRMSSLSIYDSVLVVNKSNVDEVFPKNKFFNELVTERIDQGKEVVLFRDATAAPMIHFGEKFITTNKLDYADIDFLYNQPAGTRQINDFYVYDAKIINPNENCMNGFIQQVDKVIVPLDNMAEVIRSHKSNMSEYSKILDRFAMPWYTADISNQYQNNRGMVDKDKDLVFTKAFFTKRAPGSTSSSSTEALSDRHGNPFDSDVVLKFDPEWNQYVSSAANARDAMMEDMALMIVPTDEAFNDWWNNGVGSAIKKQYGTKENVPNRIFAELINVNMFESLLGSVPSKFHEMLNDANEPFRYKNKQISTEDIDSVFLACNGAVYLSNKVFSPASFQSVLYPAFLDSTQFCIVYNAIENLDYKAYLNSMVTKYSFLIPSNKSVDGGEPCIQYIDPVSYYNGDTETQLWEFKYDASKASNQKIYADVYKCTLSEGGWQVGDFVKKVTGNITSAAALKRRWLDILDNITIIGEVQPGKKYYRTKGYNYVRVDGNGPADENIQFYGSLQEEVNAPIDLMKDDNGVIEKPYAQENGYAYSVNKPVLGTRNSVARTLANNDEFSSFFEVLQASNAVSTVNSVMSWCSADQVYGNLYNEKAKGSLGAEDSKGTKSTYLMNNYHYTIYAPTNDAMEQAFELGLPRISQLEAAEELDAQESEATGKDVTLHADSIREVYLDFVKYHIQDNSIFVDEGFASGNYETAKTQLIQSTDDEGNPVEGEWTSGLPYKLKVNVSSSAMTVTDVMGNTRNVVTTPGMYNLMAREYWINGVKVTTPYQSYTENSSSAVVHGIDGALFFDTTGSSEKNPCGQFKYQYKKKAAASVNRR